MLALIQFFSENPFYFLILTGVLALCVGSFLNVVIARLPTWLEFQWKTECYQALELSPPQHFKPPPSIVWPGSCCPHCQEPIAWYDNIPLFSFIVLKRCCRQCQKKISWQYPIVELCTALLCMVIAHHFGVTWQTLAGCILTCGLIVQSGIDLKHCFIPNEITLPLLWLGLILNQATLFQPLEDAVLGAVFGYLFLWLFYWLFKLCTGKEGMGYGDFKLLAMLGAWLGWQMLPLIILLASFLGAVVGIGLILIKKHDKDRPLPFGPYLAIAGWVALVEGASINAWYLHWILS